jgi:hypothetical protein
MGRVPIGILAVFLWIAQLGESGQERGWHVSRPEPIVAVDRIPVRFTQAIDQ